MKRYSFEETIRQAGGVLVMDGSMSTALEALGCSLKDRLWTARILAEDPDKIKQVHWDYFAAGADCGITASYQASIKGLVENGYTKEEARDILERSVRIFLETREKWWKEEREAHPDSTRPMPLCLGSCGPYGAYLADGSEYRGHYGVSDETLREFHAERAKILWDAGADLLLFETEPSLHEALIEAQIAEDLGADYWISFSCRDGEHTWEGDTMTECAKALSTGHPHLKVIGVNCTKPKYLSSLIRKLRAATTLPIAVYPNSGEIWDAVSKTWKPDEENTMSFGEYALTWIEDGAVAVGGCCTTVADHIRQVAGARNRFYQLGKPVRMVPAGK